MRRIALYLTFLTGFSGLVFQVVWQKYFSYFLGGEALSSAIVLAVFLGGLSVGYALFGKIAEGKSAAKLVQMAGLAELGIGLWAFIFPVLFQSLWDHLAILPVTQPWRTIVDISLTVLLLAPGPLLMGSTLPLLTPGLAQTRDELSKIHSRLYGINTLGAFAGALLAGFFLIQFWGLPITLMSLSLFNLGSGFALILFAANFSEIEQERGQEEKGAAQMPKLIFLLAFLSGFTCIGFETIFMRSLSLSIGTSEYSYSLVVGIFVFMIAAGTLTLRWKGRTSAKSLLVNQLLLTGGLIMVYLSVPYWGWAGYVVRASLTSVPTNFYVFNAIIFLIFSAIISVPVFFMGRTMPLLFSSMQSSLTQAAKGVGRIYAANTVGCCTGGIVMGYALLLYFDADWVFRIGILTSVGAAVAILALGSSGFEKGRRRIAAWSITLMLLPLVLWLPRWSDANMVSGLFRYRNLDEMAFRSPRGFLRKYNSDRKIIFFRDDPNTTVSVTEFLDGSRSLQVNGKSDGSTKGADLVTTNLLGHLPGLLAGPQGSAAVIGLGLGNSARAIAMYPNITRVDVFEIAKAVIDTQPLFAELNGRVWENPKVSIHQADAFRGLLAAKEKYVAVVSEPSNPWVSGIDRLYSSEFYSIVKSKMAADGVFAQWIHTYEMSPETFGTVMRTFSGVFPHVRLIRLGADMILLGKQSTWGDSTWKAAEERWTRLNINREFSGIHLGEFNDLGLFEVFYPIEIAEKFSEHSLFFPKLSYLAARDFFQNVNFDIGNMNVFDPAFALSHRHQWSDSILNRGMRNSDFYKRVIDGCLLNFNGGSAQKVNFSSLSPLCRSYFLMIAASGQFKPPGSWPTFSSMVSYFQSISGRSAPHEGFSLTQKLESLVYFPAAIEAPPPQHLEGLRTECRQQKDQYACLMSVATLQLRFGYVDDAFRGYREDLAKQVGHTMENFAFLKRLADVGVMTKSPRTQ